MSAGDAFKLAALLGIGVILLRQNKRPSIDGMPVYQSGNQAHGDKEQAYC